MSVSYSRQLVQAAQGGAGGGPVGGGFGLPAVTGTGFSSPSPAPAPTPSGTRNRTSSVSIAKLRADASASLLASPGTGALTTSGVGVVGSSLGVSVAHKRPARGSVFTGTINLIPHRTPSPSGGIAARHTSTPPIPETPEPPVLHSPSASPMLRPSSLVHRRPAAHRSIDDISLSALLAHPTMHLCQSSPRLPTLQVDPLTTPLLVVAGLANGGMALLDVGSQVVTQVQAAHRSGVFFLQAQPDGRILSAAGDGLRIWTLASLVAEAEDALAQARAAAASHGHPAALAPPRTPGTPTRRSPRPAGDASFPSLLSPHSAPTPMRLDGGAAASETEAAALRCLHAAKMPAGASALSVANFMPDGRLFAGDAVGRMRVWAAEQQRFRYVCEQTSDADATNTSTTSATDATTTADDASTTSHAVTCCVSFDSTHLVTAQEGQLRLWLHIPQESLGAPVLRHERTLRFSPVPVADRESNTSTTGLGVGDGVGVGGVGSLPATALDEDGLDVRCMVALPRSGSRGLLVTGHDDHALRVVDMASFTVRATLHGHLAGVCCVMELNDHRVASGSRDGNIKLWNVISSRCDLTLRGHSAPVIALAQAWHPLQIVSAASDGEVRLWNLASGACESTWHLPNSMMPTALTLLPIEQVARDDDTNETDAEMEALRLLIAADDPPSPVRAAVDAAAAAHRRGRSQHARQESAAAFAASAKAAEEAQRAARVANRYPGLGSNFDSARGDFTTTLPPPALADSLPDAADKDARIRERAVALMTTRRTMSPVPTASLSASLSASIGGEVRWGSPELGTATSSLLSRSATTSPTSASANTSASMPSTAAHSTAPSFDAAVSDVPTMTTAVAHGRLSPSRWLSGAPTNGGSTGASRDVSPARRPFDASSSVYRLSVLEPTSPPPPRSLKEVISREVLDLTSAELDLLAAAKIAPPKPEPLITELASFAPDALERSLAEKHRRERYARAAERRRSGIHAPPKKQPTVRRTFVYLGTDEPTPATGGAGFARTTPASASTLHMPTLAARALAATAPRPGAALAHSTSEPRLPRVATLPLPDRYKPPQRAPAASSAEAEAARRLAMERIIARVTGGGGSAGSANGPRRYISAAAALSPKSKSRALVPTDSRYILHQPRASAERRKKTPNSNSSSFFLTSLDETDDQHQTGKTLAHSASEPGLVPKKRRPSQQQVQPQPQPQARQRGRTRDPVQTTTTSERPAQSIDRHTTVARLRSSTSTGALMGGGGGGVGVVRSSSSVAGSSDQLRRAESVSEQARRSVYNSRQAAAAARRHHRAARALSQPPPAATTNMKWGILEAARERDNDDDDEDDDALRVRASSVDGSRRRRGGPKLSHGEVAARARLKRLRDATRALLEGGRKPSTTQSQWSAVSPDDDADETRADRLARMTPEQRARHEAVRAQQKAGLALAESLFRQAEVEPRRTPLHSNANSPARATTHSRTLSPTSPLARSQLPARTPSRVPRAITDSSTPSTPGSPARSKIHSLTPLASPASKVIVSSARTKTTRAPPPKINLDEDDQDDDAQTRQRREHEQQLDKVRRFLERRRAADANDTDHEVTLTTDVQETKTNDA